MSFLFGGARRELKDRTDELMDASEMLRKALDRNTRMWRKVLEGAVSDELKNEVRESLKDMVEAERALDSALHQHISLLEEFLKKI